MAKVVALELLMPVPTLVSAALSDTSLTAGETSLVTFTFSEAITGLDLNDLIAPNGTLSGLSTPDSISYTATFVPNVGVTDATNVLTVNMAGVTSASTSQAGTGSANSANYAIDTVAPTVSITSSASTLSSGETATITFTFSEAVTGLDLADMSVAGGVLSGLASTGGSLVYTATFSPDAGVSGGMGSVSLAAGSYNDLAGNSGGGGTSAPIAINTLGPTVLITFEHGTLKAGETNGVTFTFSTPPIGFTASDIVVSGGTVANLTNTGGGVYTAIFTPNPDVNSGVGSIAVPSGSYTDGFGLGGGGASSAPITFDTLRPTLDITIADTNLGIGEVTQVTFTFSEAVSGFTVSDTSPLNVTLSGLTTSDNITYTATLTSGGTINDSTNLLTVAMSGVQDAAGNIGIGTVSSPNYALDGVRPVATIVVSDAAITHGETAMVTFTFSEAVTGFDTSDVSIANGALSSATSDDGGITWTAIFTPALNVSDTSNLISLNNAGYTDLAGNAGVGVTNSANYSVQTIVPTASVVVDLATLKAGQTSGVTVTFSEAVSGLDAADFTVDNGTLSAPTTADGGVTWTATLTPSVNALGSTNLVTLNMGGVMNAAGNTGIGASFSNTYAVDTARPAATILVADAQLQAGQTSQVTITFSETVTGFDLSDVTVANGVLSGLSSQDGLTWTATLTPSVGVADATNLIVLDTALVTDAAGNTGSGISISNNYHVGYVPPPPATDDDVISLPPGGGEVAAGPGDDSVSGGAGDDVIQGNTGADTLIGGGGGDIVRGGQGIDFVHGNAGGDLLFGDLGDDTVFGGQGDDFVQGNAGGDYVLGDLGRDTVLGGQGADTVVGGDGDDYLSGDLGDDVLVGGLGADLFNFNGGGGRDVVMDFSRAEGDQIRISPTDAANFEALSAHVVEDGGNTIIELGGQAIVLLGVAKSALTAADFVFG